MDAQNGIGFLKMLIRIGGADVDDIEEAIKIASEKSPSASFKVAGRYFFAKHGQDDPASECFAFAKGTRWLAMIRRDEGATSFQKAVAELRQMVGGCHEKIIVAFPASAA